MSRSPKAGTSQESEEEMRMEEEADQNHTDKDGLFKVGCLELWILLQHKQILPAVASIYYVELYKLF